MSTETFVFTIFTKVHKISRNENLQIFILTIECWVTIVVTKIQTLHSLNIFRNVKQLAQVENLTRNMFHCWFSWLEPQVELKKTAVD